MKHSERRLQARRALLMLAPAAVLRAQLQDPLDGPGTSSSEPARLPNGRNQQDAILKADYQSNLKDARALVDLAKSFEEDLEKNDRFVLSVASLKKLDEMEKLTRRIRGRLKRV